MKDLGHFARLSRHGGRRIKTAYIGLFLTFLVSWSWSGLQAEGCTWCLDSSVAYSGVPAVSVPCLQVLPFFHSLSLSHFSLSSQRLLHSQFASLLLMLRNILSFLSPSAKVNCDLLMKKLKQFALIIEQFYFQTTSKENRAVFLG